MQTAHKSLGFKWESLLYICSQSLADTMTNPISNIIIIID